MDRAAVKRGAAPLAALLALLCAMLLALAPGAAWADGTYTWSGSDGAISVNDAGDVITLSGSGTLEVTADTTASIVVEENVSDVTIVVDEGATLTQGGTKTYGNYYPTIYIKSGATVTITNKGTVQNTAYGSGGSNSVLNEGTCTITADSTGTFLKDDQDSNSNWNVVNKTTGTMYIYGGTFTETYVDETVVGHVVIENQGAMYIYDGTFTTLNYCAVKNDNYSSAKLYVYGGTFTAVDQALQLYNKTEIYGGTFSSNYVVLWSYSDSDGTPSASTNTVDIYDGYFTGQVRKSYANTSTDNVTLTIHHGHFAYDETSYLAEGSTVVETGDSTYPYAVHVGTATEAKDATCTEDGNIAYYVCTYTNSYTDESCGAVYTASTSTGDDGTETTTYTETTSGAVTIDATGHNYDYGNITWTWADDYSSATATVVCKNDSSHVLTIDATVTSETTDATCTEDGSTTYTATITDDDGNEYSDTQTVTIDATGHDWADPEWLWTENDDGTWNAKVKFTCKNDSSHTDWENPAESITSTTDATCTEAGTATWTSSQTIGGTTYTDTMTVETDPATGHSWDYEDVAWSWADDYSSATATVTCENDSSHTLTVDATVESETTDATCNDAGATVYTATATFGEGDDAVTVTTSTTVAIDATGHTAGEAVVENEVEATCTEEGSYDLVVYCTVCGEELSRETVTVEATGHTWDDGVVTEPTCTEGGYTTYTCTVCGETKVEDETEATGHDWDTTYSNITWGWADDYSSCEATVTCKNDSSHTQSVECEINVKTTDATCTEDGSVTYNAVATFDDGSVKGTTFSNQATVTVPATGHDYDYENITWEWAEDYSSATATVVCNNDSSHTLTAEAAVTSETTDATCTEDGSTVYTATITDGDGNEYTDTQTVTIDATGHTEGEAVVENEVEPTCTEEGSYDSVVYCSVCGAEISRETVVVEATGHTEGEPVIENETDESYESVVYCTVCGEELSRETVTIDVEEEAAAEEEASAEEEAEPEEDAEEASAEAEPEEESSDDEDLAQTGDGTAAAAAGVAAMGAIALAAGIAATKRRRA